MAKVAMVKVSVTTLCDRVWMLFFLTALLPSSSLEC
jgi:hypothetical protein